MKMSYFPGCTLKNTAKELDIYARRSAEALGVTLEEVDGFQCCGGYVVLENPDFAKKCSRDVLRNAKAQGAEMIVTACPLCKFNLEKGGSDIPVVYFTELLADALGVKEGKDAK